MEKETIDVYSTKYLLTKGIELVEVEVNPPYAYSKGLTRFNDDLKTETRLIRKSW